ncbi:MAG: OB-fold domain-containing protein [Candidatus Binatia bacterium]|nr:OB-fold domain-containing protein [Candidatus Binatia bacterium]
MSEDWLLPDVEDPDSAPFWQAAARGELVVQSCAACGKRRMPPRPMCHYCRSLDHRWEPLSGRGTIWSFVIAHPPLLPAYEAVAPYNVIVVATAEDPSIRFVGNLVESPDGAFYRTKPELLRIGAPVRVVFQEVAGVHFPRWMLETSER